MRLALLCILLFVSPASAGPSAELVSRLREGSYVLYLRRTMETATASACLAGCGSTIGRVSNEASHQVVYSEPR
jgi:hypothetical protein